MPLEKIFLTKSYDIASCSVSDAIYRRKIKFLTKLQFTNLCKRFVINTVDELATMHECVRAMTNSFI